MIGTGHDICLNAYKTKTLSLSLISKFSPFEKHKSTFSLPFVQFTSSLSLFNTLQISPVNKQKNEFSFFIIKLPPLNLKDSFFSQQKRMRKTSLSSNSFGGFLSPGAAPSYSDNKGWSSERVPHPSSSSTASTPTINNGPRRHIGSSSSALTTPFYSGRAVPSKWEDAERWICSPVAAYPPVNPSASSCSQFSDQRRQKSKSGPIVPPTLPHPPPYSPRLAMKAPRGLMVSGSPFSTGVLEADRVFRGSVGGGGGHGHSRSWVDLMSEETSSLSSKTDTGKLSLSIS